MKSKIRGLLLVGLVLCSCSSVETQKYDAGLAMIQSEHRVRVLVQSNDAFTDKLIYEQVYSRFYPALPLVEREPYTAVLEILFMSRDQIMQFKSSSTTATVTTKSSSWYSGQGYVDGFGNLTVNGRASSSGTAQIQAETSSSAWQMMWQNSMMMMTLKDLEGKRLWMADYDYKGGWELSGFVVNTAQEAARLVVKRLYDRFQKDFPEARSQR